MRAAAPWYVVAGIGVAVVDWMAGGLVAFVATLTAIVFGVGTVVHEQSTDDGEG